MDDIFLYHTLPTVMNYVRFGVGSGATVFRKNNQGVPVGFNVAKVIVQYNLFVDDVDV